MIRNFYYTLLICIGLFLDLSVSGQSEINKDSLIKIVNSINEDSETVKNLNLLSEYFLYQNIDSAGLFCKRALEISEKLFYRNGIAESYQNIGKMNMISGNYKESLNYFYKALKVNDELKDSVSLGKNYAGIGIIHYYQGDTETALSFCKKAAEIYITQNYLKGLARVYNSIGLFYSQFNELDTAQNYFDKTIEISKITKDSKIEISALGNSARILLIKKDYKKAVKKFYELIDKTDSENDKSTLSVTYANIAVAYLNLAKNESDKLLKDDFINKALKSNFTALKFADELNSKSLQTYVFEGLTATYKEKKDFKNAFLYLEKFKNANDSIFNQKKTEAIATIEAKFENEKKQLIIDNLQKEKQTDLIIIKKKNTIILLIIIGFLSVIILLLFLYKLYRSKRNALKLLDEKNKNILKQRAEISAQRDKISEIAFELKKNNRTKNKLFSIIAHDLKNPFQGIIGFSELIKEEAEEKGLSQIAKFSDYIYDVSSQTYKLLDNLLDFTRSQIGLMKYNPEIIKIKNIVNEGILLAQSYAEAKGVKLIDETDETTFAYADKSMISTVIRNLISNAVKFTSENGFVKVTAKNEKNQTIIKIIDNGVGIKEKDLPKLFKADLNFSTFGTQKEKGTGLGLVVCKDFIVKNGGTITVKSEEGKGSTFTITLPSKK